MGNKLAEPASMSDSLTEINKLPRPTSSSHSLPGNGRILNPFQTAAPFASDKGGAAHNFKADKKERKLNGVIVSQPLSVNTARPQVTGVQTDQIAEVPVKPPHPDTKYQVRFFWFPKWKIVPILMTRNGYFRAVILTLRLPSWDIQGMTRCHKFGQKQ